MEIPAVRRVSSSNQPFIYKSQIYTDNFLASSSAAVVFGLPSTKQSITPKDSGNAPDYSYTVKNYFQVTNVRARTVNGQTDVFDWTNTANQVSILYKQTKTATSSLTNSCHLLPALVRRWLPVWTAHLRADYVRIPVCRHHPLPCRPQAG